MEEVIDVLVEDLYHWEVESNSPADPSLAST